MDIATFAGIVVGAGLVVLAVLMNEGLEGLRLFVNPEAILVVLGGTFCALLVNYPMGQVIGVFRVIRKVLFAKAQDTTEIITTFVRLCQRARTEGFVALETDMRMVRNDFMKRGIQMVIDGHNQEFIRNMLETEIGFIRERHKVGQEIFTALGTYSPAFGIIGTVLGMILMLRTISDVEQVPGRMALALASAFFGLGAGYLIFLPMSGKLRRRSEEELFIKEIIIRGVLLLQGGVSPRVMEENLKAYLDPAKRMMIKTSVK